MDLDKEKVLKLVIVALATLAALAVMSTLVQLIQTILPFLIVGAGIYAGYRWALGDAPAPSAEEVEEQARGLFSRFRRTKQAVETTMQASGALEELANPPENRSRRRRRFSQAKPAEANVDSQAKPAAAEPPGKTNQRQENNRQVKSKPAGPIEFRDSDVVIKPDDVVQPDISRLEEKEREVPEVTNNVLEQIEERRRRLGNGS